jgi:hypothetical protein
VCCHFARRVHAAYARAPTVSRVSAASTPSPPHPHPPHTVVTSAPAFIWAPAPTPLPPRGAQVSKWLAATASAERNYGLQILLSVVSADPETVGKLVGTPGAVRAVLGALRRAIGGDDEGLFLASEAVRVLTHSPRFIASMFVAKEAAGLPIILTALSTAKVARTYLGMGGGGAAGLSIHWSPS